MAATKKGDIQPVVITNDLATLMVDIVTIAAVNRLRVEALLAGPAGSFAQGDFDSLNVDEATATALWTRAAVTGLDTNEAAGSRNVPVAVRGAVAAQAYTLKRLLGDSVIRGDDGATYSAVGARAASANANYAAALVGLLANTRPGILDERVGTYARLEGLSAPGSSGNEAGLFTYTPRQDAFPAMLRGRRFYTTHQTLGTFITGQTVIAPTTPTFLLRQAATTVRVIMRSVTLTQQGVVAGGAIFIAMVLDTADRFSAGGTSVVPQNVNGDSATASGITSFLTNPTATAAGAGTRVIVQSGAPATLGVATQFLFNDGVLVPQTGAFLIYTQAATTGPSWAFITEHEEIPA